MPNIDTSDHDALAGAVYFAVGRGTEGGPSSYHLSIAGVTSGVSDPGWGDASNVATNSGYTFGTIQVDLGQRGTWPVGAAENAPLKPGEKTYVDAIIDQSSIYAKEHGLKYTSDVSKLHNDLFSHGDGQDGRSTISFIDKDTRDSINAWASSPEGKQWVHKNIDYPQVKAATETAVSMLDKYGKNIPEDRRFETVSLLAKTANQMPSQLPKYQAVMEKGGNYDDLLKEANNIKKHHSYYDGPKAAAVAEKYENAYNDPSKKDSLDRAHTKVSSPTYDPSKESGDPDIKEALKSINQSAHTHAHNKTSAGILREGMHGDQVQKLQTQLGELGYLDNTATPDGKFGSITRDAVKAYQHDHHLPEVGQAGPATQKAVQADLQPLRHDNAGPLPAVSAMSSLPASAPGLDDPRNALNPNHALYNKIQHDFPDASEQRLLQFTAACHSQGITGRNLTDSHFDRQNGIVSFAGTQNFAAKTVSVDLKELSPPPAQSIQHIQQTDQQQVQIQANVQATIAQNNQQGPQGPTPGGAPGR